MGTMYYIMENHEDWTLFDFLDDWGVSYEVTKGTKETVIYCSGLAVYEAIHLQRTFDVCITRVSFDNRAIIYMD